MIDLKDCTFIIPIKIESDDRKRNLQITLNYLQRNFDTNIIVYESDKISRAKKYIEDISEDILYMFEKNETGIFHRTRMLNEMTEIAKTNIIVNYDIDVIFSPQQLVASKNAISINKMDLCFPYSGAFHDVPDIYFDNVKKDNLEKIDLNKCPLLNAQSVGGAFFFNKERYKEAGYENENFVSWGYEDNERIVRLQKLNYAMARIEGPCYHLTHSRDQNGWFSNPYIKQNESELEKIKGMNALEIMKYVKSWEWIK